MTIEQASETVEIAGHQFEVLDKIRIKAGMVTRLQDDLIHMVYTDEYTIEVEHVREFNDLVDSWMPDGEGAYFIVNLRGKYNDIRREAQDYLAKDAPILFKKKVRATAVIIDNLAGRILSKFFIQFFKPKYPTKIFSTDLDALNWLKSVGFEQR